MSKNNKYGSAENLRNAIKALHSKGIQVIADWVPDQIYALPGEEIVTATRVNDYGEEREGAQIKNKPYAANTKSSGKDYQAQYGGEFLEYLQEKYPSIFERVMISNGKKIDPSTKIKVWKAEYFNGTNILGKGSDYVLNDQATGTYFTVNENGAFLPKQMTSDSAQTGFYYDGKGMTYYSTSGYQAKSSFVLYNGNHYYFDEDGHMVTGMREIDTVKLITSCQMVLKFVTLSMKMQKETNTTSVKQVAVMKVVITMSSTQLKQLMVLPKL